MNNPTEAAHYAALEQRVTGLESSIAKVGEAVTALGNKFDARSTTQWPVILTSVGVGVAILTAIGGLAYRPIDMAVSDAKAEFSRLRETVVPRAELDRNWHIQDRELSDIAKRIDRLENETLVKRRVSSASPD